MKNPHAITVVSQKKFFQIDFVRVFKAIIKGAEGAALSNPVGFGLALVDLSQSFSRAKTVEQKAYLLITEGYIGALASTWRDHWHVFKRSNDTKDLAKFAKEFDLTIAKNEPELLPDFFLAPHRFSVVPTFQYILAQELPSYLTKPELAEKLSEAFPKKFYESVIAAWNKGQDEYQDIWGHFKDNQFLNIQQYWDKFKILAAQESYHHSLMKMYHEVVMDNKVGMTLRDIYIEPSFLISERCFDEQDLRCIEHKKQDRHSPFIPVDYQGSLHQYLDEFLKQKNPLNLTCSSANVMLLLGYPGQGKTSFCKRILYDILGSGKSDNHVFYLPLRLVKNVREQLSSPLDLVLDALNNDLTDQYPGTVTENLLRNSILVLDGLDEIFQREGLSHKDIDDFCRELGRLTIDVPNLKIILTSRYGYINLTNLRKKDFFIAQLEPFTQSQQSEWLKKYKKFHPHTRLTQEKLNEINHEANTNYASIRELINQPILLQLVATADYELQETDTRTKIYDELFQSLIDRNWSKGGQLDNLEGLEKEDILSYLSEIAVAIYRSEFEYIRKIDLEELPASEAFLTLLKGKEIKDVLKNLMIAFYMKEVKKEGNDQEEDRNYAIEFLHKSLQEYLVAKNIWTTVKNEFLEYRGRSRTKTYVINSWRDALIVIRRLFAYKELSSEVQEYLMEVILQDEEEEKQELQRRLLAFFPEMMERDFGEFSKTEIRSENSSAITESLNSFYGCWFLISHIGCNELNWHKSFIKKFTYLLRCPPPQLQSPYFWMLQRALLQGVDLDGAYLDRANLEGANLQRASLQRTSLYRANLQEANLQGANLQGAILQGAFLKGAFLQGANLQGAKLQGAILQEANLQGAILDGAFLQRAILWGVNLQEADLQRADLEGADLQRANLQEADLQRANLEAADLQRASLQRTSLQGANLQEADLQRANLRGANLWGAKLDGADLEGANLERANVDDINWLDTLNLLPEIKKELLATYIVTNVTSGGNEQFIIKRK